MSPPPLHHVASDESRNTADRSTYPPLEKPIFHDIIPAHLLVGIDAQAKYVIEQLSMISQQNEWLIKAATDTNTQVRHTNGRLIKQEEWKASLDEHNIIDAITKLQEWKEPLEDRNILAKVQLADKLINFWTIIVAILVLLGSCGASIIAIAEHFHWF